MGIYNKTITGLHGVNFTKEVDGPTDYSGLTNNTYFKDLSDGLPYWKNASGTVISLFSESTVLAVGNVLYVATTGSNSESRTNALGNIAKPLTPEQARSVALSGDTIHVMSGSYTLTLITTNGYAKDGVNWVFMPKAIFNKATTGAMFNTVGFSIGCSVYGEGDFYGTGSCGRIYYDGMSATDYTFEGNICENTAAACHETISTNSGIHNIRFKVRIKSTASYAVLPSLGTVYIDCPEIISTTTNAIYLYQCQKVFINGNRIENSTGGIGLETSNIGNVVINSAYINKANINTSLVVTLNVANMDALKFNGSTYGVLKLNGQTTAYEHVSGHADIERLYNITISGTGDGTIRAGYIGGQTMNLSSSNTISIDLYFDTYSSVVAASTFNISSSTVTVTLHGDNNRGLQGTISAGKLRINNYNGLINNTTGGGKAYCLRQSVTGTIELLSNGVLDSSANTTSTLYLIWKDGGTFISKGGTIITYDSTQIGVGDSATIQDIKIYSSGLNTNQASFLAAKTGTLGLTDLVGGTIIEDADIIS